MLRPVVFLVRWCWWSFIASKWSGGGPRHTSYAHARLAAHLARCEWELWVGKRRITQ